ncbi:hypothetical protein LZ24_02250 [Desulfobotulus alkaliphilus]|uniref:Cytochrome c domain-containing protein n=1 Tax=Desulfobotulus alkaliphilus TaxID=622671 RepID=A0A562RQQ7_9BACT|nr:hypothetical protein [Desulfobotulus alkaliphilus]TWI70680.1 hypothetical protein LZ24_02250 [Desulfobotulus alkaliphilus]
MKHRFFTVLIIGSMLFSSCGGVRLKSYEKQDCETLPGQATLETIENRCMLCHKGDFATVQDICERKDLIIDAVETGRMPRFSKLTQQELEIIVTWQQNP